MNRPDLAFLEPVDTRVFYAPSDSGETTATPQLTSQNGKENATRS